MSLTSRSVDRHRTVTALMVAAALVVAAVATLPTLLPRQLGSLHRIQVDTDPENMLSGDEPVRVFHDEMKERLALHDMVVVGVVNESHPAGVFNPQSLAKVQALTRFAETLHGPEIGEPEGVGVIRKDLIAPGTVDTIEPTSAGVSSRVRKIPFFFGRELQLAHARPAGHPGPGQRDPTPGPPHPVPPRHAGQP